VILMAIWWISIAYNLFACVMVATQFPTVHLFQIMVLNVYGNMWRLGD
jgi:hypothetical protein